MQFLQLNNIILKVLTKVHFLYIIKRYHALYKIHLYQHFHTPIKLQKIAFNS